MKDETENHKRRFEDFSNQTLEARWLSERDRDYKDNKQWTDDQVSVLNARGQAPVTDNRVKQKVEGLKGLLIQRRTDPKGHSRTKAHEAASEAVTDALRYVADNTEFDDLELAVFDNLIVEGYGGCIVDIVPRKDEIEINPTLIPWDRIYFDPYSRRLDFKDAQYMGIVMWMDEEVAKATFPKAKDVIEECADSDEFGETFSDRPKWREVSGDRKRIRLAHEFYQEDGKWMECIFCGNGYLAKPRPSTYLDEDGQPENPIELVGAYIDRDNNRFGEVRYWIDLQNEVNHRRSKFLFTLSHRQTVSKKGAVKDIPALKRELSKPNGHVEYEGDTGDFDILRTNDMADAQFKLLEQTMQALDSSSFNAQLSGERQGNLSGVAVESLQMAGMLEVNSLFNGMSSWKKRVFRQIWNRVKQHWNEEKWIRVTDDFGKLRWVGINVPITRQQKMEEFINDESQDPNERKKAAEIFMQLMQTQDPRLQEMMETQNPIPELDMDIILEMSTNSINTQQEQFKLLAQLAANRPEVPFISLLKLSELRDKDDLIKDIEEREKMAMEMQQRQQQLGEEDAQLTMQGKQIENQKKAAEIDKVAADTTSTNMDAITKQVKNQVMLANPDPRPQSIS